MPRRHQPSSKSTHKNLKRSQIVKLKIVKCVFVRSGRPLKVRVRNAQLISLGYINSKHTPDAATATILHSNTIIIILFKSETSDVMLSPEHYCVSGIVRLVCLVCCVLFAPASRWFVWINLSVEIAHMCSIEHRLWAHWRNALPASNTLLYCRAAAA